MKQYKKHIFICVNGDKEKHCGGKGSENLRQELKKELFELYGPDLRVNKSGCLGNCKDGICAVVYPDAKWFYHLKPGDKEIIKSYIQTSMDEEKKS